MFKSLRYVFSENTNNIFRIYSIAKYEILGDIRESKLGIFWNFANPLIQVLTYWFVFGYVLSRGNVGAIPYFYWMLGGIVVWFFMSPCITHGANAIYTKVGVITKMKFPVSILPTTIVIKELFNHGCLMVILVIAFIVGGYYPSLEWFGLIYYLFAAATFATALAMNTSVLNMLARDTRKLILACMRLLLYLTPILWTIPNKAPAVLRGIMNLNPIYYIVQGYRDCFFYHNGIMHYKEQMVCFWAITIILMFSGCYMLYKFKHKFIDMI